MAAPMHPWRCMLKLAATMVMAICSLGCGEDPTRMPPGFTCLPSGPRALETTWSEDAQGLAHDATSWFFSNTWGIFRVSVLADPSSEKYLAQTGLPYGCGHIGDIDQADGLVYVPLEKCGGGAPNRLSLHDPVTLEPLMSAVVPSRAQRQFAWVAVSPIDGTIYSSDSDSEVLNVFAPGFEDGRPLTLVRRLSLGRVFHRIAGGAFGVDGRFYLVSDDSADVEQAGIFVFELGEDRADEIAHLPPPADYPGVGGELEGIDLWDIDAVQHHHPSVSGQIHWLYLDNDVVDRDNVSLGHVGIDDVRP